MSVDFEFCTKHCKVGVFDTVKVFFLPSNRLNEFQLSSWWALIGENPDTVVPRSRKNDAVIPAGRDGAR